MPDSSSHDALRRALLAQAFIDWLENRTGARAEPASTADGDSLLTLRLGGERLLLAIEPVAATPPDAAWQGRLAAFEERLEKAGAGGVLVWLPAGAEPPLDEPAASETVQAIGAAAAALAPGAVGDARLPITLYLRRRDEAGAYITAYGGMAQYWAQFTERVQGYFQLDSKQLHRLPDDEAYIKGLVDRIVDVAQGMTVDEMRAIPAEDFWRVQRLRGGEGCAAAGRPAGDEAEQGAPLRRRLRTALQEAGARFGADGDALRVLLLYGHYPTLDGEPVGPALRGMDPSLFAGIDFVALLSDGTVKPLLDITRRPALAART